MKEHTLSINFYMSWNQAENAFRLVCFGAYETVVNEWWVFFEKWGRSNFGVLVWWSDEMNSNELEWIRILAVEESEFLEV